MDITPRPSSRIRFLVYYDDKLVPLEQIVKLGDSYKFYNAAEEIPQLHDELLKYRDGQSASWSNLPAELRLITYKYAYASPPNLYRGFHMKIFSGHRYRTKWWDWVKDLSLNDDDIVVQLPHLLADRFISKQWLFETADTIAKLKNWHLHVEDKTWDFAIRLCERKLTDTSTLDELGQSVCAIMLQHISWMSMHVNAGNKISEFFKMEHFETCDGLDYIQMTHEDWWDNQYWIKNQSSDSEDELEVTTIHEANANANTDTDTSAPASTVAVTRQNIHTLTREAANALKTKYEKSIYEDDGLPENMRTSIFKWSVKNDAFKDFSQMFKDWKGPDQTYPSEFLMRASCAIEGSPKQSLCFEMRIETCSRMLLRVFEQESKIHDGAEIDGTVEETTLTTDQDQRQQNFEQQPVDGEPNVAAAAAAATQTIQQDETMTEPSLEGTTAETAEIVEQPTEEPREGGETPHVTGHNTNTEGVIETTTTAVEDTSPTTTTPTLATAAATTTTAIVMVPETVQDTNTDVERTPEQPIQVSNTAESEDYWGHPR